MRQWPNRLIGVFERRLLARTFEDRHLMLNIGTGEMLERWADDVPGTAANYLAGWQGRRRGSRRLPD